MSGFRLVEVELSSAPAPIALAANEKGVGLIVRRRGRPVGFAMLDAEPGSQIPAEVVARLATSAAAEAVVADALRDELVSATPKAALPTVSIAICTHDRTDGLLRCLTSIARMRDGSSHGGRLVEVLVVDNAPSTPATRDAVTGMPGVRYVLERKTGLDFARNCAWQSATGDVVAYLDDDVVVDAGWLDGMMRALANNPDASAITGLVLPYTLADEAHVLFEKRGGFRRGFLPLRWRGREHSYDRIYPLGSGIFGAGANMAIRRDVLAALGGFDEALDTGAPLPGGGDLDIFYRVLRAGHALVYEPGMAVRHEHRSSVDGLRRQYYTWGLGFFAFLGKVWEAEPGERAKIRLLAKWWTLDIARTLKGRLAKADPTPVEMSFSELAGGLEGAMGEYRRSLRRVAEIRRRGR